jgi:hypothetical protein
MTVATQSLLEVLKTTDQPPFWVLFEHYIPETSLVDF